MLVLLHNFAATDEKCASKLPLRVKSIIQQGNKDSCPNENLRRSTLADIGRLLNKIDPRTRTCECGYIQWSWMEESCIS